MGEDRQDYATPADVKAVVDKVPQGWVWGEDTLHTVIATVLNHEAPRQALLDILARRNDLQDRVCGAGHRCCDVMLPPPEHDHFLSPEECAQCA